MIFHKRTVIKFLLVVALLSVNYYDCQFVSGQVIRCIEREREALVKFKKGLVDDYGLLSSWGDEENKMECCKWRGVVCSSATGHVIALELHGDRSRDPSLALHGDWSRHRYSFLRGKISPALLELRHLSVLDIGGNDFGGDRVPEFIGSMKQLQHLNLNESSFSGIIPPQLGNLTNLRTLDLSYNSLRSENLDWLSHLSLLSLLDLSGSSISDVDWLQQVLQLHSLQELYLMNCMIRDAKSSAGLVNSSTTSLSVLELTSNELTSSTFDWLFNISSSLVILELSNNPLDCPIPDALGKLVSLSSLGLSSNMLRHEIPKSLGNLSHLRSLLLSHNQLTGLVPVSLGQLPELESLDVSFNSLEGTISEANFMKLQNLYLLDLSFNPVTVNITPGWSPPFQLDFINLAGCNNGPHFPAWIQTQSYFTWLDLSYGGISDEMPKWLTGFSSPAVEYLNLSHNQISGSVPDFSSKLISIVDLSSNMLSGTLPLFHPGTWFVQLSENMFSGSVSSICTVSYGMLALLDISNNQLSGELPSCWGKMTDLQVLGLANNNFSGEIPRALGSLSNLRTLHLRNNSLLGELPSALKNCRNLRLIDVARNKLTGNIPAWIGANYGDMTHLSFRHNRFYGIIPPEICSLAKIQMLDLSRNNISGKIPECFDNFTSLADKNGASSDKSVHDYIIDYALVQWKGQELGEYPTTLELLKLIDLSSNRLVGNIPEAFSSLKGLISLNLSRNSLTGNIIPDIGEMEMLEILDLSRNQLSGQIPIGMAQLHYLAVLDLADNNLSGKIPVSTQLQSFNASVYAGNGALCGLPLALCPGEHLNPPTNNQGEYNREKDGGSAILSFVQEFYISMVFGFILGFWGVVGSLLLKRSWRRVYFNFLDEVGDWLYLTTTLFLRKFRKT